MFDPAHFHVAYPADADDALPGPQAGSYLSNIPYNPVWQAKYDKIVKDTSEGRSIDRVAVCEPYAMPRLMGGATVGAEIIQAPDIIIIYSGPSEGIRKIFLDGRPHPGPGADGAPPLTHNGDSVGHWEGDVLVVDTVNIKDAGYYDQTDAPHSDKLHMIERFRMIAPGYMEVAMTLDDPVAFTHPWQVKRQWRRNTGPLKYGAVQDNSCVASEGSIDMSKGYQSEILPQEREAMEAAKKAVPTRP